MTGRQRWEVGESLVDASESIICSFHTASLNSSSFLSATFVRIIFLNLRFYLIHLTGSRAPFLLDFFFCELDSSAVQQGDIERASLEQENKHHCSLSYTVTKGNISFPCMEHSHRCKCAHVGCLNMSATVVVSCTDGTMSLHDEDASETLCLFMCDHVCSCRDCCTS